jgi:tetratricopeptide (TPR) repeat protein/tRNA A-37 threonylcarbamoyl transferase component Bud32
MPTIAPAEAAAPSAETSSHSNTRASNLDASGAGVVTSAIPPTQGATGDRYVLSAFHARGGMGEVWRCHDATIGREVALKRLLSDRIAARERFLCEAQITGQLEHPAIVPIHDLGYDDNGRPFYVMKFVHGRTLKSAVDEFHAADDAHPPETDAREPREVMRLRLLSVFVDLCDAVAYAHSRGVIHRDLKPENVMLGAYGETVVLDWGLAKLRGHADVCGVAMESSAAISGASSASRPPTVSTQAAHTEDGSILGSPLYMPPEMAEGHMVDADQRTDVYLLGATLYEILTGRPPRQGASRDEILEMARTAPPVPPRTIVADTPRALEAICLKAMARAKSSRYQSASEVRDDVQRFMAGEAVHAHRESAAARAWRWAKRNRRILSRAAAVTSIATAMVSALLFYGQARAYRAREVAAGDVRAVRKLADEARFYAVSTDPPGERAPYFDPTRADRAGNSALTLAAQRWGADLARLPVSDLRDPLRNELAEVCILLAQSRLHGSGGDAAAMTSDAAALLDRGEALAGQTHRGAHRLRAEIARIQNQPDVAAREQQAADSPTIPPDANDLFLQGEHERRGIVASADGTILISDAAAQTQRTRAIERAMNYYRAALRKDPGHYWSRLQLGRCYLALGRGPEAVEALDACIALRPQSPWGYSTRGLALGLLRRFDEANQDLERALQLDPSCLPARLNRAMTLVLQGNDTAAAVELDAMLATPHPPPEAAYYRGQMLLAAGDASNAIAVLDRADADANAFPLTHVLRAKAYLLLGQNDAAIREADAVVAASASASRQASQRGHVLRLLAAQLPAAGQKSALQLAEQALTSATRQPDAPAIAFADLGAVLHLQGRSLAALDAFARAIELSPTDPQPRINRGWVLDALDRAADAETDFAAAIKLVPHDPEALAGLGYVFARRGRAAEARERASMALLWSGNDYRIVHNVACIYGVLSAADPAQQRQYEDMTIALLERAMESSRNSWGSVSETDLIAGETLAFPPALRQRAEFKHFLSSARERAAAAPAPAPVNAERRE